MRLLFCTLILLSWASTNSQPPEILKFQSYAFKLCVNKTEQLVITTRAGEVAMTRSVLNTWRKSNPVPDDGSSLLSGETYEQANFFNNDTGFVSGFINYNGKYNIVYRTTDAGKSWKPVDFGQSGWVDHAVNLDNGEAWMSVAGSGIAYSADYGRTWTKFELPEKKQRFSQIYFNSLRQGLIGSLWNMIAYTNDNCEHWKLLPTPLDQHKYSKTNKESRPEIERVAIFGDYFLVSQEELVFYTKRDSIDWKWLPDYSDFFTDAENSALYFLTYKNNFVNADKNLQPMASFQAKGNCYDAKCRNGNLFVMCGDQILKIDKNNIARYYFIYSDQPGSVEATPIGYTSYGTYGASGNRIYLQTNFEGNWVYKFTLPFNVDQGSLSVYDGRAIIYSPPGDSVYYFDLASKTVNVTSRSMKYRDFASAGISQVIFERGSSGCFHHFIEEIVYEEQDGNFKLKKKTNEGSKHPNLFKGSPDKFDSKVVDAFAKNLFYLVNKKATIEDLQFSKEDYDVCKKNILAFQASLTKDKKTATAFSFYKNNLDFERLLKLVDSIKMIDSADLNRILFSHTEVWSTTTNWSAVRLVNRKGQTVRISTQYYQPNAFYFPWQIWLEGDKNSCTAIEIDDFINKSFPKFFENDDKVEILQTLVKRLY